MPYPDPSKIQFFEFVNSGSDRFWIHMYCFNNLFPYATINDYKVYHRLDQSNNHLLSISMIKVKKGNVNYNNHYWIYLNMSEYASTNKILNMLWVLNMPKFWICQYSEYSKVLNMEGFSICKHYIAFWICQYMPWQSSEYISGFTCASILNMVRFWICKSYTRF